MSRAYHEVQEIGNLLASVHDEVRAVKEQISSLPLFPKGTDTSLYALGQNPPQIAKLQSQLNKFESVLRKRGESLLHGFAHNVGPKVSGPGPGTLPAIPQLGRGSFRPASVRPCSNACQDGSQV